MPASGTHTYRFGPADEVTAGSGGCLFNRRAYANSLHQGLPDLKVLPEPGSSGLDLIPLRRSVLKGELAGPLASMHLIQTFDYSRQQCDKTLEVIYRFPLPGDAAVIGVTISFGGIEVEAQLQERQQTEREYEEAKRQGKQAVLTTRESPDVFTLRIAGLQPDQEITVDTFYVQMAIPRGAGWSLRLPTTIAPRYSRVDETEDRHASGQPLALGPDPGHRFRLDLEMHGAESVTSPTHPLDVSEEGKNTRVRLQAGDVVPDRDLVLAWLPRQQPHKPMLQVITYKDGSQWTYFMALVAPPAQHRPGTGVPREVVLLLDQSGSMAGPKWQVAVEATMRFLRSLNPRDTFALGLFNISPTGTFLVNQEAGYHGLSFTNVGINGVTFSGQVSFMFPPLAGR